jgi:ABC-type sulfate transport system permease subunit
MSLLDRVHEHAKDHTVSRLMLTLLAVPFYVLGIVVGAVIVLVLYGWAAVRTGVADVRGLADRDGGG